MPIVYVTDTITQVPTLYRGELEENAIRAWATDILKQSKPVVGAHADLASSRQEAHKPRPIADPELEKKLKKANVPLLASAEALDDMLAFEGDDICVYVYSSAIDDDMNRKIVELFSDLAVEVRRNTKKLRFVAYDVNLLGQHRLLEASHPNMWLSPGNARDKDLRLFRGQLQLDQMADWLKKHASNKYKMNTANLDQKIEVLKYAQSQGLGGSTEKPKSIMDEVEEELKRRGEL